MRKNIFAYTSKEVRFPAYLSINKDKMGNVSFTIRSEAKVNKEKGFLDVGEMGEIILPKEQIAELQEALKTLTESE